MKIDIKIKIPENNYEVTFNKIYKTDKLEFRDVKSFIKRFWKQYERNKEKLFENRSNYNNHNGKIFELLLFQILKHENIIPFFYQAKLSLINNTIFDFVYLNKKMVPIVLFLKTSLRERYKQAELEARLIKNIFPGAKCYIICLENDDKIEKYNKMIDSNDIIGIDKFFNENNLSDCIKILNESGPYIEHTSITLLTGKTVNRDNIYIKIKM